MKEPKGRSISEWIKKKTVALSFSAGEWVSFEWFIIITSFSFALLNILIEQMSKSSFWIVDSKACDKTDVCLNISNHPNNLTRLHTSRW